MFVLADVITNLMWTDVLCTVADVDTLCYYNEESIQGMADVIAMWQME